MTRCDRCDAAVESTWSVHVRSPEMTHRRSEDVCLDCHPYLAVAAGAAAGGRVSAD